MIDLYFSVDIEADGPIPGDFSMLSYGICLAGAYDGKTFTRSGLDRERNHHYIELQPISERFDKDALKVSGLDRNSLIRNGYEPTEALLTTDTWISRMRNAWAPKDDWRTDTNAVFVAYPLSFDWLFMYWYFEHFVNRSPFGFSNCLDIKTMYQVKAQTLLKDSTKKSMPKEILPSKPHTHNALYDAIEQAELFQNLWKWSQDNSPDSWVQMIRKASTL